jgi:hypothetical protein
MTSRSGTTTHSNSLSSKRQKAKFTPRTCASAQYVPVLFHYYREADLVPVPEVATLEELTDRLSACCIRDLDRTIAGRPRRSVPGYECEETDCRLPLVTRFLPAPLVARRSAPMSSEVARGGAPSSRYPDRGGRAEMDAASYPSLRVESLSAAFLMTSVCRRGHHAANE